MRLYRAYKTLDGAGVGFADGLVGAGVVDGVADGEGVGFADGEGVGFAVGKAVGTKVGALVTGVDVGG